jgi:hypothetical protein
LKSASETFRPSTFGSENSGAWLPSGSIVDAVLTMTWILKDATG